MTNRIKYIQLWFSRKVSRGVCFDWLHTHTHTRPSTSLSVRYTWQNLFQSPDTRANMYVCRSESVQYVCMYVYQKGYHTNNNFLRPSAIVKLASSFLWLQLGFLSSLTLFLFLWFPRSSNSSFSLIIPQFRLSSNLLLKRSQDTRESGHNIFNLRTEIEGWRTNEMCMTDVVHQFYHFRSLQFLTVI